MGAYELVMQEESVQTLMARPRQERQALMDQLARLKTNPSTRGQRTIKDLSGREHQIIIHGQWEIVFWADHAVKELRVVRLRKITK